MFFAIKKFLFLFYIYFFLFLMVFIRDLPIFFLSLLLWSFLLILLYAGNFWEKYIQTTSYTKLLIGLAFYWGVSYFLSYSVVSFFILLSSGVILLFQSHFYTFFIYGGMLFIFSQICMWFGIHDFFGGAFIFSFYSFIVGSLFYLWNMGKISFFQKMQKYFPVYKNILFFSLHIVLILSIFYEYIAEIFFVFMFGCIFIYSLLRNTQENTQENTQKINISHLIKIHFVVLSSSIIIFIPIIDRYLLWSEKKYFFPILFLWFLVWYVFIGYIITKYQSSKNKIEASF